MSASEPPGSQASAVLGGPGAGEAMGLHRKKGAMFPLLISREVQLPGPPA